MQFFRDFPRYVGNPYQFLVKNEEEYIDFLVTNNGRKSCYSSVYTFPKYFSKHGKDIPIVNCIFFDLDDNPNLEEEEKKDAWLAHKVDLTDPYDDILILSDYCESHDFLYDYNYSGMKGFHFYLWLNPIICKDAKEKLTSIHNYLVHKLNLKTVDPKIIGDYRRILRIPNTLHPSSKKYCVVVENKRSSINDILQYAKHQHSYNVTPNTSVTIDDLFEIFPKDVAKHYKQNLANKSEKPKTVCTIKSKTIPLEFIDSIIPFECLAKKIRYSKPSWDVRFRTASWLKYLGYSPVAIATFFSKLHWVDWELDTTLYYIEKTDGYPQGYKGLKKDKICLGDKCKKPCYNHEVSNNSDNTLPEVTIEWPVQTKSRYVQR